MKLSNEILNVSPVLKKLLSGDFTVCLDEDISCASLDTFETSKKQTIINFRNWELVKGVTTFYSKDGSIKINNKESGNQQDFRIYYMEANANTNFQIDTGGDTPKIQESSSSGSEFISDFTKLETDLLLALKTALILDGLSDLPTVISRVLGQEEGTGQLAYTLAYIKFHQN